MRFVHAAFQPAGDGPFPTVIAFHGWGANALDLLGLAPYIAGGRCLVICPQGPLEVPVGPMTGYGWFPIRMGSAPDEDAIEAAVMQAREFVAEVPARYRVDPRKLILVGFSQGGVMAYNLAVREPEKFAGLVAMSTWFPPELARKVTDPEALQRIPTLVQHGRADDMIEISRARQSVESLRALKVPLVYREYDCGHEITADGLADLSEFLVSKVIQPIVLA